MIIYNDTILYIFQFVYVQFMSCFEEWITCRWNVENHITMYTTEIDNWYVNMFFLCKTVTL